jgi:hypothetical protein
MSSIDTYLATSVTYVVVAGLYLRPHTSLFSRISLTLAALLLAAFAAANSNYVRTWETGPDACHFVIIRSTERLQWGRILTLRAAGDDVAVESATLACGLSTVLLI